MFQEYWDARGPIHRLCVCSTGVQREVIARAVYSLGNGKTEHIRLTHYIYNTPVAVLLYCISGPTTWLVYDSDRDHREPPPAGFSWTAEEMALMLRKHIPPNIPTEDRL